MPKFLFRAPRYLAYEPQTTGQPGHMLRRDSRGQVHVAAPDWIGHASAAHAAQSTRVPIPQDTWRARIGRHVPTAREDAWLTESGAIGFQALPGSAPHV